MEQTLRRAKEVVSTLQKAGFVAYFAGGYVRDYLMGHSCDDIDIATSAPVETVRALFAKTIPVGIAFGIVIVVVDGQQFEVATFRKDRNYVDGRRPTGVDPATAKEDAARRDFTINGLFLDPLTGTIFDYIGGKDDIKARCIRAIGNPDERFFEDRLRMIRAVRYSTRFDFPIERQTCRAIEAHAKDLLPAVAIERIWQEFNKMARFSHFDKGLILLHTLGLLPVIFPQLKEQSAEEIRLRVRFIEKFPRSCPTIAKLLELFPKIELKAIEALTDFLKLSGEQRAFAKFYHHATILLGMPEEWLDKLEPIKWARFYADPHAPICLEILAAKEDDPQAFTRSHNARRHVLLPHIARLQSQNPYLRAHHLIEAGVKPGVKMGNLLEEGMRLAVNEGVIDPQTLIEKLRATPLW